MRLPADRCDRLYGRIFIREVEHGFCGFPAGNHSVPAFAGDGSFDFRRNFCQRLDGRAERDRYLCDDAVHDAARRGVDGGSV